MNPIPKLGTLLELPVPRADDRPAGRVGSPGGDRGHPGRRASPPGTTQSLARHPRRRRRVVRAGADPRRAGRLRRLRRHPHDPAGQPGRRRDDLRRPAARSASTASVLTSEQGRARASARTTHASGRVPACARPLGEPEDAVTTSCSGITWEHARGYGSVAAAAAPTARSRPTSRCTGSSARCRRSPTSPSSRLVERVRPARHRPPARPAGRRARALRPARRRRLRRRSSPCSPAQSVGPSHASYAHARRTVGAGHRRRGPGRGLPPGPAARAAARLGRRARARRAGARALAGQAGRRVLQPRHRRSRQRRGAACARPGCS